MNPAFLSANESLKSKILRRVREDEEQLSPETMDTCGRSSSSGHRFATRKQTSTANTTRSTRKDETVRPRSRSTVKSRSLSLSLRSSFRTQMKEALAQTQSPISKLKRTNRARGRGGGKPIKIPWVQEPVISCEKEAKQSSSFFETLGDSRKAKPQPGPIKRCLQSSSSASLVSAPSVKVRRVEDDSKKGKTPPRSPSPRSAKMKISWTVPASPCSLVIVEKKSPGHQRKISINESAKAFCSSTDSSCNGSVQSTKTRRKKSKVRLTKQMHDSCPVTEKKLSKTMQTKSNISRKKVTKQKKNSNDAVALAEHPTHPRSKAKVEKIKPMNHTNGTDDHLNYLLQDSQKSNPVGALSSVISQTSPGIVRKEHGSLVRELIHRRINQTLVSQNDQNTNAAPSTKLDADAPTSAGIPFTAKHQPTKNTEQKPSQSDVDSTTDSMTVTKTAAAKAAKAVGGISLMPLYKASHPDFLPTISSPCTPTMTVMKASSDQTVSSTMSSESNLKGTKTKVPNDPETLQLSSGPSGTSSCLQAVAQCKCVASISTAPTPSLIEMGNMQAAQPIFLSPESFQLQPISYPGMGAYNLDINEAVGLPQSSSKQNKKRKTKKKSLSPVSTKNPSSSVTVSSASSSPSPDAKGPDFKDPSLDDKGEKIKRPMNAFMIWSREQRSILARQRPRMTNANISIKLGVMWNDLDYDVKQKYFDEAIKLKLQHRKDYPDWVYQPRPHKRSSLRKHQPIPFYEDQSQQIPYTQMVLIMPDGQQVLCPAIPAENCQGAAPVVTNFVIPGPQADVTDAKNIPRPNKQVSQPVTTEKESNITPGPPADAQDVKMSANWSSEHTKSKMLVIMPDGQVMCPAITQQNGQATKPVTSNIASNASPGTPVDVKDVKKIGNQLSEQPKSKLLLVMPDGKQVLCPEIPKASTDVKDVVQLVDQPSHQSKSSEEKPVVVKSEKCGKCGDKNSIISLESQSSLPTPISLIQVTKDTKDLNTKTATSPHSTLANSVYISKEQQSANEEKKMVTSLQLPIVKGLLGISHDVKETVVLTKPAKFQSDTPKVMEMNAIVKSEAVPVPIAITAIVQAQPCQGAKNTSTAKTSESIMLTLSNSNQQSPLIELNSLQVRPVNGQIPTQQASDSAKETDNSSRPHPADNSSQKQRQKIPKSDSSQRFPTDDFSRPHAAFTLVPVDLQEPVVHVQRMSKDTGVQTLQNWSSCPSNAQTNQILPSQFPRSILKNQPIDMVWQADSRILQPANISDKGTSTSFPFYFTPIQQVPGVQDTSTIPSMGSPAVLAPVESCMVPLPTATLTDSGPHDVAMPATQFADTPTLCEISEPDRLLESLAMGAVEISEDEAEETENLFQRVMDMVSD